MNAFYAYYNIISIVLESLAMIFLSIIVINLLRSKPREKMSNSLTVLIIADILLLLCDMLTNLYDGTSFYMISKVAKFFTYCGVYLISYLFYLYLAEKIKTKTEIPRTVNAVFVFLLIFCISFVIISQFNNMYYYYNAEHYCERGEMYWLSQGLGIVFMFMCAFVTMLYSKFFTPAEKTAILTYPLLPSVAMLIQIYHQGISLNYVATSIAIFIIYMNVQINRDKELLKLQNELTNQKVAIMLSQVQPHFLYNALTTIKGLCIADPELAEKAVDDFASFLRGNMDSITSETPIPFNKEVEHTKKYCELEKMRFGDRVNIVWDTPVTDFLVPALTLQPLVENAVRYGITKKPKGGTVKITTVKDNGYVYIEIIDDGVGYNTSEKINDGRSHVGIKNTEDRLFSMCGGTLKIKSVLGKGTRVEIKIPEKGKK